MSIAQAKYNIVIIGVSYFGGMASSTRVRNLLDPLIKKDYINASNLIYEKDANEILKKEGALDNVNYRVIGFRKSNPFSAILFIWNGIRFIHKNKSRKEKNILYNYDRPNLKNILFLFYTKLIGYKIMLDIIEDYHYYTKYPRFLTRIKMKSSNFFIKYCYLFADGIITISDHLFKQMEKFSKSKVPVYQIPITVDLKRFEESEYKIPEHYKIFYGGSFGEKDGLEYLIKAFEKISLEFNNVSLILTGKGAYQEMEKLFKLIDNSVVKEKIIFKGFLSKDEYYNVLNECDIFCMTRINSQFANAGFPFKLGEFLATGKAVISTNVSDVNKFIRNGENALIIRPSSEDEIAEALIYILKNPILINKLGTEGRKTAELNFDSEKISLDLFQIFGCL